MTKYEQELKKLNKPSYSKVIEIACHSLTTNFSMQEIRGLLKSLRRGTAILESEEQLWCYNYYYGEMHQAKMTDSLDKFLSLKDIVCDDYSIIDWGCGQGVGTVCMFDYLAEHGFANKIKKVVLIEPSKLALENAVLHTSVYGVEDITPINKYLNDVVMEDITTDTPVTIHIFSNILDVEGFSLKQLAQTIDASARGKHYFICIGPLNPNNHRIKAFYKYFAESDTLADIEKSENQIDILREERHFRNAKCNYTIQLLIFEYVTGKSYVIQIEYFPPVQFFAGAELDCVRKERKKLTKENSARWKTIMAFEVAAPFDLGACVYDDVHPILAVLNNIITRGLPARTSPFIEDVFSCFGNTLLYGELGEIEYHNNLPKNKQEIKAHYYSPIGIARIQKTVLEALMTGVLSLEQESWNILIRERDVPCGAMAFSDLNNMFDHISSLSVKYQDVKLPKLNLDIICEEQWENSPLHMGVKTFTKVTTSIKRKTYDLVLDVSVLSSIEFGIDFFSEFICKNNCYFVIRSSEKIRSKRYIYTSDTIEYLTLGIKSRMGDFEESDNTKIHLTYFLNLLFRKKEFRPGQIPILDRALQNKNVIGLLPTGGGKSLTYQLAGMMQPGVTLVIDPLRSLMKDQYDGLLNMGIDTCTYINSSLDSDEKGRREKQMEASELQFVFLSPERLCIYSFREKLKNMHDMHVYFSYGVIDEVHCVSEWGHDFRFSYLHLGRNMYNYVYAKDEEKRLTLFGLTATASFDVLADVERELSGNGAYPLDADTVVRYENTDRLELQYRVERVPIEYPLDANYDKNKQVDKRLPRAISLWDARKAGDMKKAMLPQYIRQIPQKINELKEPESIDRIKTDFRERHSIEDSFDDVDIRSSISEDMFNDKKTYEQAGIVFCLHRKTTGISVAENANALSKTVSKVGTFVGASDNDQIDKQSLENLDRFRNNELPLMVATKAFGMGIDKPNVRFTINMNYPSSLEGFVQEAGRAGRDRKIALATILFSDYRLARISRKYMKNDFPLALLRNKWFKQDELVSILHHYGIEIEDDMFELFTPESDLVKITCAHNNKIFAYRECSEDECNNFLGCKLKDLPNEAREFKLYDDLKETFDELGMELPTKDLKYFNPDYNNVMYFYNNSFKGDIEEKKAMNRILSKPATEVLNDEFLKSNMAENLGNQNLLEVVLAADVGTEIIAYIPYSEDDKLFDNYTDVAKAIYRMCSINFIDDFTQDYMTHRFRIVMIRKEDRAYYDGLKHFLMRYYSEGRASELIKDVPNYKGQNEVHKCLGYLTEFVYSKIAVKRKRAIDDMRLFCLQGLDDSKDWKEVNEDLKDFIYYYFNSKYANEDYVADTGEPFSLTIDTDRGKISSFHIVKKYMRVINDDLVGGSGTPIDNLKHLQGAVRLIRRALTEYNPVMSLLNFFCLVALGINNNASLENELKEDYKQGILSFAEKAESKEEFWDFYQSFHNAIWSVPQQYDLANLSETKEEIMAKAHLAILQGFKNRYCQ